MTLITAGSVFSGAGLRYIDPRLVVPWPATADSSGRVGTEARLHRRRPPAQVGLVKEEAEQSWTAGRASHAAGAFIYCPTC